ncbi:MAG: energy transducer TonB [Saprospiraceae bacterium]
MEKDKKKVKFLYQPQYPGGVKALNEFIYKHLRYPKQAFEEKLEGMVVVEYDINQEGAVTETRILQHLGSGCDEEAARVVRMLRFDVPKNRGIKATFHRKAYIRFKLPKQAPQPAAPQLTLNYLQAPAPATPKPEPERPQEKTYTYTIHIS